MRSVPAIEVPPNFITMRATSPMLLQSPQPAQEPSGFRQVD